MAELITQRIRHNANELRLHGIAENPDELIDRAQTAKLGYREFLDLVLEAEVGVLEGRRYQARLKMAGLPHHKTLDEFDITFQPELDPKRLAKLRSLRFVERKVGCLILGPPGVGKSHISVGLAMERSPAATSCATPRWTTSSADCATPTHWASSTTSSPSCSDHTSW